MRPMPGRARSLTLPSRERPPSQYITSAPLRSRIEYVVMNASSSKAPRRTGKTPPGEKTHCPGGLNSCDFAMKRTRRRMKAPTKKWSMNDA
jgi:hypothetical protein